MILIFNYDFWYDCESIRQDSKVTIQFIGKACLLITKIKSRFQMFNFHTGSLKIQVQIDVCTNKRSHHFTEKNKINLSDTKSSAVAKWPIWCILNNEGILINKYIYIYGRQPKLMIRFVPLVKKNLFTPSSSIKRNPEAVDRRLSKYIISRCFHEWKYRVYNKMQTTSYTQQEGQIGLD